MVINRNVQYTKESAVGRSQKNLKSVLCMAIAVALLSVGVPSLSAYADEDALGRAEQERRASAGVESTSLLSGAEVPREKDSEVVLPTEPTPSPEPAPSPEPEP